MTNGNDLAYPTNHIDPDGRFEPQFYVGLTKREHFAAMAMQGMLASGKYAEGIAFSPFMANISVEISDALIAALNANNKTE